MSGFLKVFTLFFMLYGFLDEMTEQALESNINDSMYFKIDEDDPNVSVLSGA